MVRHVLELLGSERVVDADRGAARVHEAEVGDHMLRCVARHDQTELPWAEAKRAQRERHSCNLVPIVAPRQRAPVAVVLPAQGGLLTPLSDRVCKGGADRFARHGRIDRGALREHVHIREYTTRWWWGEPDLRSLAPVDRRHPCGGTHLGGRFWPAGGRPPPGPPGGGRRALPRPLRRRGGPRRPVGRRETSPPGPPPAP